MSAKPQSDSQDSSNRNALPFEPTKNRKQVEKKAEKKAVKQASATSAKTQKEAKAPTEKAQTESRSKSSNRSRSKAEIGIPEVVSRRMVRRMALFCGIPSALGISTFVVSYLLVSQDAVALPTVAVLFLSLGFFGLGVLGLSYGVLSASWEEDDPGSAVGWSEFRTNFGRMVEAWRSPKQS